MAKKTKKEFDADEAKAVYSYNDKGMLRNGKFVMNKPYFRDDKYEKDVAEWKKKEFLKNSKETAKNAVPIKLTPSKEALMRLRKLKASKTKLDGTKKIKG